MFREERQSIDIVNKIADKYKISIQQVRKILLISGAIL